jgi:hypothetical protein
MAGRYGPRSSVPGVTVHLITAYDHLAFAKDTEHSMSHMRTTSYTCDDDKKGRSRQGLQRTFWYRCSEPDNPP